MALTQAGRRTEIITVLEDSATTRGKLALGMAQGAESFSLPYTIDLQMYADHSLVINPSMLINTPARVLLRVEDETEIVPVGESHRFTYQVRKGIFQTFATQPRVHFLDQPREDIDVYVGRLVPAFQIMAQEVRYRVFEKLSVVGVIEACMKAFQGINLQNYLDASAIPENDDLRKVILPHAIQYGESTFNFLSRLMNRSSIWYTFEHGPWPNTPGLPAADSKFERMVIGKGPKQKFDDCLVPENYVNPRNLRKLEGRNPWQMLSNLARTYSPAPKLVRVGEFNTVNPIDPLQSADGGVTVVAKDANIINTVIGTETAQPATDGHLEPQTSFIQESFPDLGAFEQSDVLQDAQTALEIAEAQVETLTGTSANASFISGRQFKLTQGGEERISDDKYLITQMGFAAYDNNYLYVIRRNALPLGMGALLDDLVSTPITTFLAALDTIPPPDVTSFMSAQALNDFNDFSSNYVSDAKDFAKGLFSNRNKTAVLDSYARSTANNVAQTLLAEAPTQTAFVFLVLNAIVQVLGVIVTSVLKIIALALDAVATLVLGIPALIQLALQKPTTLGQVWAGIGTVENFVEKFLKSYFRPKYVDAFSATFSAVKVIRSGQRQGAGLPLPAAQKTVINGPHLATVIGPQGVPYNNPGSIYADKLGRVRIRFPWDRSPEGLDVVKLLDQGPGKGGEQFHTGLNTVWVRVSDAWAGLGFGSQFLPRVGDEVVVSFIDGDPDRPVITGRLYNPRDTGLSNLPFPAPGPIKTDGDGGVTVMKDLVNIAPAEGIFTRSGIKTQTVPKPNSDAFHLLRFDDKAGKEQLLLRSQGRLDITSLGTTYHTTGGDYNLLIGGIDVPHQVAGGNYIAKMSCDYTLHVGDPAGPFNGGHRYERVEQTYDLNVVKDVRFNLEKDFLAEVIGWISFDADTIVLNATKKITLSVGGSWLTVSSGGVHSSGPLVTNNSGGSGPNTARVPPPPTPPANPAAADPGTK